MATDYLSEMMEKAKKEEKKEITPEQKEEETIKEVKRKDLETLKNLTEKSVPEIQEDMESAEKSEVEKELEKKQKIELKSYGKVKIFKVPGNPMNYYYVPTLRPTPIERKIINTIKEATTRLVSIAPYKIRNPEERRVIYKQKILEIIKNNPSLKIPSSRVQFYSEAVVRDMVGYGLIDDLIKDDNLEEIMVVGPKKPVFVFHREFEMMNTNIEFISEQEIEDLVNKIAREVGRRVDVASPLLDARLIDGSRVNATIPPASISGGTLTIRKFRADPYSIIDLIRMGTISSEAAAFLWMCVDGLGTKPANMLISGGTGSGKTTLLNVLASFVPDRERIVSIEDTAELNLPLKHWIRLEARPPGLEGSGELKMDILTKNSLRMRPDRIIVGEIRHEEAFTLFTAINTGHDGAIIGDTLLSLENGEIIPIEEFANDNFDAPIKENDYEFCEINKDIFIPSLNKETLQIENKRISRIWRKQINDNLVKIKLKSGKEMTLTKDHPLYKSFNGIQEIAAGDIRAGDFLATPTKVSILSKEKIKTPYLVGLVYGDGHVGQEHIEFVSTDDSLIEAFVNESKKITENKITVKNFGNYKRVKFFDKKIVNQFSQEYNIPIGNKTKIFEFKNEPKLNEKELCKVVRGLFDSEAHINLEANCIQFSTSNKNLAKKLPLILQRFGIHTSTYAQQKDGKGNIGPYYRISIYGKDNISKYKKHISFTHSKKVIALEKLLNKSKDSIDSFPSQESLLRDLRAENKMTQKELSSLLGNTTFSTIASYENSTRSPSRNALKKIVNATNGKISKQLEILANSNIHFEQITSIEQINHNGYVYDLTVEDNHNYIANGTIVSNCMGTVHANSPDETIIRVTSPPMNVPQIMLAGLDIIIVEHRFYDRKKGTIRRISEIAEVHGSLEGKSKTNTIFERDPVTDTLERTLLESNYLKELQKFTGLPKQKLVAELEIRKKFLDKLVEQNIREITKVSEMEKDFLGKRKTFGEL